jgi:hypothetical protein
LDKLLEEFKKIKYLPRAPITRATSGENLQKKEKVNSLMDTIHKNISENKYDAPIKYREKPEHEAENYGN